MMMPERSPGRRAETAGSQHSPTRDLLAINSVEIGVAVAFGLSSIATVWLLGWTAGSAIVGASCLPMIVVFVTTLARHCRFGGS